MLCLSTLVIFFGIASVLFLLFYTFWAILRLLKRKKSGPLAGRFEATLKFLEKEGSILPKEYEDYFNFSPEQSRNELLALEKMGFLKKVANKGNHYYRYIGKK